jgi:hypothetical protein
MLNSMSGPIRDYRDLVAWQQAIELAVVGRVVARKLPRSEWELASQLRRASTSVDSALRFTARQSPNMREAKMAIQRVVCVAKPLSGLKKSLERKLEDEQ